MPQTKHHKKYFDRMIYYETNLELVDSAMTYFIDFIKNNPQETIADAHGVKKSTHKLLASRKNTKASRESVGRHLTKTTYSGFFKELYEELIIYLQGILLSASKSEIDPKRFVGEHKITLDVSEILEQGSWNKILEMVSDKIFRALENEKSTSKMIEKINKKLGLELPDKPINDALPYIEIRHLLVHQDGRVENDFVKKYPKLKQHLKNGKINLTYGLAQEAKNYINDLVKAIDKKIIAKNLCPISDIVK